MQYIPSEWKPCVCEASLCSLGRRLEDNVTFTYTEIIASSAQAYRYEHTSQPCYSHTLSHITLHTHTLHTHTLHTHTHSTHTHTHPFIHGTRHPGVTTGFEVAVNPRNGVMPSLRVLSSFPDMSQTVAYVCVFVCMGGCVGVRLCVCVCVCV